MKTTVVMFVIGFILGTVTMIALSDRQIDANNAAAHTAAVREQNWRKFVACTGNNSEWLVDEYKDDGHVSPPAMTASSPNERQRVADETCARTYLEARPR